jgi:hypothetical protein
VIGTERRGNETNKAKEIDKYPNKEARRAAIMQEEEEKMLQ